MPCGEPKGQDLLNGRASNGLEELEEEEDSDPSSPPLPYLHQGPAPDGCCTMDGKASKNISYSFCPGNPWGSNPC